MTITLTGEPKSTQTIYKYACRGSHPCMYMTKAGKKIKNQYRVEALERKRPLLMAPGCIPSWTPTLDQYAITATFYFGTKRKCDLDNFNKLWMDALTGIVYEDDSQIAKLTLVRAYDKKNPRIEVTVEVI